MRIVNRIAVAFAGLALALSAPAALAAPAGGHELKSPKNGWTFDGPFGTFDQLQLQRGYKVYREVCSSCHGMKLVSFRNLGQKGGPFYDAAYPNPNDNPYVKQIVSEYQVDSVDQETGDIIKAPAKTSDRFPSPYANDAAARGSNGGALPPDLSVIVHARHDGANYIYSLLHGYYDPPAGLTVSTGQHYNAYFAGDTASQYSGDPRNKPPGGFLAMAPPLREGLVTYDDGSPSTVDQMSEDVAAFLAWASDPKMQTRKQMGFSVLAYLALLALVAYASYRQIWSKVEH